jgi:hypothetical protein
MTVSFGRCFDDWAAVDQPKVNAEVSAGRAAVNGGELSHWVASLSEGSSPSMDNGTAGGVILMGQ